MFYTILASCFPPTASEQGSRCNELAEDKVIQLSVFLKHTTTNLAYLFFHCLCYRTSGKEAVHTYFGLL